MRIDFCEIPDAGLNIEADVPLGWLDTGASDPLRTLYTLPASLHLHAHLERNTNQVFVTGDYEGEASAGCVRCVRRFSSRLSGTFRLTLLPRSSEAKPAELELESDDVDLAYYDEEFLDLARVVSEQVILGLELYPHCQPSCKGLCPDCGTNLNEADCSCGENRTDSRWAALKQIKLASSDQ